VNSRTELTFFLILFALTSVLLFLVFQPFVQSLLLGVVGALIFYPLYGWLHKLTKGQEALSALVTILIVSLIVLVPLLLLGTQLFIESRSFYETIVSGDYNLRIVEIEESLNQSLDDWIGTTISLEIPQLQAGLTSAATWLAINSSAIVGRVFTVVFKLIIGIIAFYYFLKHGLTLRDELVSLSPLKEDRTRKIMERFKTTVRSVVEGSLVVALVQGLLLGIGFALFGVPQPVLWGSMGVLAALIPGIGTILVSVPAVIYLFAVSSTFNTVGFAIWGFLVVGLADNLLRPILIQRYLVIHPLFIFLSVIGGIGFFGPLGFIWGPILLSLLMVLLELYKEIILDRV